MAYEEYLKQLEPCPSCGEEDLEWCGISVRPYCKSCGEWGYINHYPNGPDVAIASWNNRSKKATKDRENSYHYKMLEKYNQELGVDLTIKDLIEFHRAHSNNFLS